jgi:hypothetical protein
LPKIVATTDLPKATEAPLRAVAESELSLTRAADLCEAVDTHIRAIETADIHQRVMALEDEIRGRVTPRR